MIESEAEWLGCLLPRWMLKALGETPNERKVRLLLISCAERVEHLLTDSRSKSALACARRVADGQAMMEELEIELSGAQAAFKDALRPVAIRHFGSMEAYSQTARMMRTGIHLVDTLETTDPIAAATQVVLDAIAQTPNRQNFYGVDLTACALGLAANDDGVRYREMFVTTEFIRDVFGNPFRPVAFDAEWNTSTVVALAQEMYTSRDFRAMPILADALQDAGCNNDDILQHCRGDGPHVRGCWVVDGILGKS